MALQRVHSSFRLPAIRFESSGKSISQFLLLLTLFGAAILTTSDLSGEQMQSTVKSDSVDGILHQRTLMLRAGTLAGTKKRPSGSGTTTVATTAVLTVTSNLPNGTAAAPYVGYIAASGGVSPYFFSVSAGALPQGLFLDSRTGEISGTPTAVVSKTFWVRASDSAGNTGRSHVQITVTGSTSTPTTAIAVSLSPTSASMTSGTSQQFSASVQGTSNTAVNWAASAGSITSTGLFTAPKVSTNTGITITATSAANSTVLATAAVSVNPSTPPVAVTIAITPSTATLSSGGAQQFSASVQGTSNTGVSWSATSGSVSSTGLFTAPVVSSSTNITITAASQADPTVTSSASVTVVPPPPVSSGSATLCGTDSNGVPSDNSQCGVSGTNPYSSEGATDLTSWCGGSLPGVCKPISNCAPTLTNGAASSRIKYYLTTDLNCGTSSLAMIMPKWADVNLNGHTVTGIFYSVVGTKGLHLFNGNVNCSQGYGTFVTNAGYVYGCIDSENNGGTMSGVEDQIVFHHLQAQNWDPTAYTIRVTGPISAPAGGWAFPALLAYNNSCQSTPVLASGREHACIYSETQPVEFYNIRGDVGSTGQANASQLLEVYGPSTNAPFPNYIHNNFLTCEVFNITGGDSCRPILCDGALDCHIAYNDIAPTNNRGIRLRDAINAEVDHNYIHGLIKANGYAGAAVHSGDNDIHTSAGQALNQSVHDNTIELGANSLALMFRSQQGLTFDNNTYLCASSGCSEASLANIENFAITGGLSINQTTKVLSCATCDFYLGGRRFKTGSYVTLSGWNNAGNNHTFLVTVGPNSTMPTQLVLSDPNNQLVAETGTSTAGVWPATKLTVQSASFGPSLVPQSYVMPQAVLQQCSDLGISVTGGGSLLTGCN